MDRYVNMFVRVFMRQVMTRGIRAGFDALGKSRGRRGGAAPRLETHEAHPERPRPPADDRHAKPGPRSWPVPPQPGPAPEHRAAPSSGPWQAGPERPMAEPDLVPPPPAPQPARASHLRSVERASEATPARQPVMASDGDAAFEAQLARIRAEEGQDDAPEHMPDLPSADPMAQNDPGDQAGHGDTTTQEPLGKAEQARLAARGARRAVGS